MIDKKIIITTPEIYSQRLREAFESAGFKNIFHSPAIVNRLFDDDFLFNKLFDNFSSFDCVVLPSLNAISAFINAAKKTGFPRKLLKHKRYAAIGNDSKRLESLGLKNIIITDEPSTSGIVRALSKIREIKELAVLIPKVEIIPEPDIIPEFIRNLSALAELTAIQAYSTSPNPNFDTGILSNIKTGDYDLLAVTSGGEIEALRYILNSDKVFQDMKVACFGPFTEATAKRTGLTPAVTGTEFSSFTNFAKTVKDFFNLSI